MSRVPSTIKFYSVYTEDITSEDFVMMQANAEENWIPAETASGAVGYRECSSVCCKTNTRT
jgi:hypothetical protein